MSHNPYLAPLFKACDNVHKLTSLNKIFSVLYLGLSSKRNINASWLIPATFNIRKPRLFSEWVAYLDQSVYILSSPHNSESWTDFRTRKFAAFTSNPRKEKKVKYFFCTNVRSLFFETQLTKGGLQNGVQFSAKNLHKAKQSVKSRQTDKRLNLK